MDERVLFVCESTRGGDEGLKTFIVHRNDADSTNRLPHLVVDGYNI